MRRKWSQMLYEAKRKAARHRKSQQETGGGTPDAPPPTDEEERVLETLDPVMVEGISGGYETGAVGEVERTNIRSAEPALTIGTPKDETPRSRRWVDRTSACLVAAHERQMVALESIASSLRELTEILRQQKQ